MLCGVAPARPQGGECGAWGWRRWGSLCIRQRGERKMGWSGEQRHSLGWRGHVTKFSATSCGGDPAPQGFGKRTRAQRPGGSGPGGGKGRGWVLGLGPSGVEIRIAMKPTLPPKI